MWGLIKTLLFLAIISSLAYGIFIVELGGATLASHSREVWSSPIVQKKVLAIGRDIEKRWQNRDKKESPNLSAKPI
jgi:hypothetical protein